MSDQITLLRELKFKSIPAFFFYYNECVMFNVHGLLKTMRFHGKLHSTIEKWYAKSLFYRQRIVRLLILARGSETVFVCFYSLNNNYIDLVISPL